MKSSSARDNKLPKSPASFDFDLPVEPTFVSKTHPMSADALYRHNQWLVQQFNTRSDAEKRRLLGKCDVEFVL